MCIKIQIQINKHEKEKLEQKTTNILPNQDALLAEYQTAQDSALQADSIAWQIGSILIGGSIVLLSVLGTKDIEHFFFFGGILLVNLVLMCWLLFFQGQYQIKMMKLYRIIQIEILLGLKQNYYWAKGRITENDTQGIYRTYGPGGKVITELLYVIISFGYPILGIFRLLTLSLCSSIISVTCLGLSFIIPIITLICYDKNARAFKNYYNQHLRIIDPIDS